MSETLPKYTILAHTVVTPKGNEKRFQLVSRPRQRKKAFMREHGGLSGRQFKRARKRGNREAKRKALPLVTGGDVADAA